MVAVNTYCNLFCYFFPCWTPQDSFTIHSNTQTDKEHQVNIPKADLLIGKARANCGCGLFLSTLGVCAHQENEHVHQARLLLLTEQITACVSETLLRQQRAQPGPDNHHRQPRCTHRAQKKKKWKKKHEKPEKGKSRTRLRCAVRESPGTSRRTVQTGKQHRADGQDKATKLPKLACRRPRSGFLFLSFVLPLASADPFLPLLL